MSLEEITMEKRIIWGDGSFKEVVQTYSESESSVSSRVLEKRKALFKNLKGNLLSPSQNDILDFADKNAEQLLMFESGGTFGFFVNNFLDILYADAVSAELNEIGKKAVNFLIIDPTDVSRFERILNFSGKKIKVPVPEKGVYSGVSTKALEPPREQDIDSLIEAIQKESDSFFEDVRIANYNFKRDKDLEMNYMDYKDKVKRNLGNLRENLLGIRKESKDYREFTEKFLMELISPLAKNSVFVSLNQWQSCWGVNELFKSSKIYDEIDEISSELEKENTQRLKRGGGVYSFPFRIDDKKTFFQSSEVDLDRGVVYLEGKESLEPGTENPSIDEVFTNRFNLIPKGGLLYTIDSLIYNAIPLVPAEKRVLIGYTQAERRGDPKPFLVQHSIPFISFGRRTKSSPEIKTSGAIAAYLEGVDSYFLLESFRKKEKGDFKIFSPLYEKFRQPLA